jgi:hypothetical protein
VDAGSILGASGRRTGEGSRLGRSLPGAIAGAFLVSAIALGAVAVQSPDDSDEAAFAGRQASEQTGDGPQGYHNDYEGVADPTTAPTDGATDGSTDPTVEPEPADEPTAKPEPKPEATAKPTPKPEPKPEATAKPTPKPEPTATPKPQTMELTLWNGDGYVKVAWSACAADFDYYKVVRSTDSTVRWPLGANDTLVGAISPESTHLADKTAPADRTLWYRVFCVRKTSTGYTILNSSAARSIHTPDAPEPTPAPQTMGLAVSPGESGVLVDWTTCEADKFDYYKVVRSTDSTVKWPLGAYDSLVFYTSDRSTTSFVDTEADPGNTYFYRVFCLDSTSYGYVTLNSTVVEDIHVPASEPTPTPETVD